MPDTHAFQFWAPGTEQLALTEIKERGGGGSLQGTHRDLV